MPCPSPSLPPCSFMPNCAQVTGPGGVRFSRAHAASRSLRSLSCLAPGNDRQGLSLSRCDRKSKKTTAYPLRYRWGAVRPRIRNSCRRGSNGHTCATPAAPVSAHMLHGFLAALGTTTAAVALCAFNAHISRSSKGKGGWPTAPGPTSLAPTRPPRSCAAQATLRSEGACATHLVA